LLASLMLSLLVSNLDLWVAITILFGIGLPLNVIEHKLRERRKAAAGRVCRGCGCARGEAEAGEVCPECGVRA
jgi:hypothetical protein